MSTPASFYITLFICLFLAVLGLCCCEGLPAAAGGTSTPVVLTSFSRQGLLLSRARALGTRAPGVGGPGLQSTGSVAVAHGLSCSGACGIFLAQGSNPCLLHRQADSLPLSLQRSPFLRFRWRRQEGSGLTAGLSSGLQQPLACPWAFGTHAVRLRTPASDTVVTWVSLALTLHQPPGRLRFSLNV